MTMMNENKLIKKINDLSPSMQKLIGDVLSLSDFDDIAVFPGFCDVHVHFR